MSITFFVLSCIASVFAEDVSATFKCNFEDGDCGIVNIPGSTLLWERKSMNLADRDGYVLALQSSTDQKQSGKVMSPRFELNRTMPGCLTFDLYITENGVLSVQMENGAEVNKFKISGGSSTGWGSLSTNVNIVDYITFYFEGEIKPSAGRKTIALDNIVFELNNC